jgi:hypothetical protein
VISYLVVTSGDWDIRSPSVRLPPGWQCYFDTIESSRSLFQTMARIRNIYYGNNSNTHSKETPSVDAVAPDSPVIYKA